MSSTELEGGIAGHLGLEYANTVDWRLSESPQERLHDLADVIAWSESIGLIGATEATALGRAGAREPTQADEGYRRALLLRDVVYRIFAAVAQSMEPTAEDLDLLRLFHQISMTCAHLVHEEPGYSWSWGGGDEELAVIMGPIAAAAVDLLQSDELDRVGQCADDRGCGWLFLDGSRNRSRRWCSMESCGNRAKVMRHHHRLHG